VCPKGGEVIDLNPGHPDHQLLYRLSFHSETSYVYWIRGSHSVVVKSSVFWDITPCSLVEVNRRIRGTCPGLKNKPRKKPALFSASCWLLA
jgi:hypothetical protein